MDVRLTSTTSCRSRVLDEDQNELWETLASMGRPLWYSFRIGATVVTQQNHLNKLAASKLLIGLDPKEGSSYNDSTLHGVASLFCRVGLRSLASDPVAARLVADFMSVMHYVTYKNDAHITSYSSDPIVTFGASYLWYQLSPPALESQILPQFQAMLANGVVDTGNIGEIVARIFLLLAMDATITCNEVLKGESARKAFVFSGQFCDLTSFVNMLLGENPAVRVNETPPNRPEADTVKDWLAHWEGWRMGLSHFAEMSKMPAQDILWKMLDRRAAGIMPRNQDGVDLVIPIFRNDHQHKSPAATSFILIQVKNLKDKDQGFPTTALANLEALSVTDIHYTSNRAS